MNWRAVTDLLDAEAIEWYQSQLHMATGTPEFILPEAQRAKLDREGVMCLEFAHQHALRGGPRGNVRQ